MFPFLQELEEDEKLFAQERDDEMGGQEQGAGGEARKEGGESSIVARPTRPIPVHRMQVPPESVGDLLMVWDFLKVCGCTGRYDGTGVVVMPIACFPSPSCCHRCTIM